MAKKELTKTSLVLMWAMAGAMAFSDFLISPKELKRRAMRGNLFKSTNNFDSFLYYLVDKGYIKYVDKNNERFLKITSKGELATLLAKSKIKKVQKWDGKWRLVIFDIPEESHIVRDRFRKLLKTYGYKMLQASVFVSPYPLNREAVDYLKQTGLIGYIRILKVEEIDDDKDLKKHFGLSA